MTIEYTPQCAGRYVLVGTSYSLLLVDVVNKKQVILHRGYNGYYGFTATETNIYIGVRDNKEEILPDGKLNNGKILVYDYDFNLIEIIKPNFPLHDIHEIVWHKNKLYITNTYYDMIAIFDGISWEQWYPLGKPKGEKQDIHHFNTLTIRDEKIYIGAHNFGPSKQCIFSLPNKEKISESNIGKCAHNIWFTNESMFVCSSDDGTIINNKGFIKHIAEWPRGIALCNNTTIVGSSAFGTWASSHIKTSAHLYIYDNNWTQKGLLLLRDENQVFDILPIEQLLDPAKLFNDNRFKKEDLAGISPINEMTKNEEDLLDLYSATHMRAGYLDTKINDINYLLNQHSSKNHFNEIELFRQTLEHTVQDLDRRANEVKLQTQSLEHCIQNLEQCMRNLDHRANEIELQAQNLEQCMRNLDHRTQKLEGRTLLGRWKKLKHSIKKRLNLTQ